jgi:predicted ATPase
MGDAVNLAARLMSSAAVGSAYVAPTIVERSRTMFATTSLPPFTVKGKSEPVTACDLGAEVGDRPETNTSILPFTGRDRELTWIVERITAQGRDARPAVTVVGDAGIGKTRLLQEALTSSTGHEVIEIRAEPYGTATPYRALRDVIRDLLGVERAEQAAMAESLQKGLTRIDPDLEQLAPLLGDIAHIDIPDTETTAAIEAKFRRDRIADAVIAILDRVVERPLLVLADDAHWLDPASSGLLDRIVQSAADRRWTVVTARRPGRDGFTPRSAETLELAPLEPGDTERIIAVATATTPLLPHDADTLAQRSGGIPLYLEEMIKAIRDSGRVGDLPEGIDGVIGAKIDALPPLARTVLRYAAVLGRSFRVSVLQQVIADDSTALDAATRQQLADFLEEDGSGRLRFRHSLARDVAYEGLSYRARRELHLAAGAVIEAMAGDDVATAADNLAIHFSIGGNPVKAWEYARTAGDRALAMYANVEAAEQYERALAAGRRLDSVTTRDRVRILTSIGDARERAGMFDAALAVYRRAHSLVGDPVTRAQLLEKRARVFERTGAYAAALSSLTRGTRLLERCDHPDAPAIRAELLSFAATVRQAQQRPRMAHRKAVEAAAAADAAGAKRAAARARSVLGGASLLLGKPEEALAAWDESLALYRELDDLSGEAAITSNLGVEAYYDGDWDRAVELYKWGRAAALQAGNVVDAAVAGSNIGEVLVNQGRADEAEPVLREAARVLRTTGLIDGAIVAELYMARLLVDERRHDEASDVLDRIETDAAALGLGGTTYEAALIRARIHTAEGRCAEALDLLRAAAGAAPDHYLSFLAPSAARIEAEALAARGDLEDAIAALDAGRLAARAGGMSYEEALLDLTAAHLTSVAAPPGALRTLRTLGVRRVAGSEEDLAVSGQRGLIS